MTRDQWSVVSRIFHDVVDLPAEERLAFVEAESCGDAVVHAAVKDLLLADACGANYLDLPAAAQEEFQPLLSDIKTTPLLHVGDELCSRFQIVRLVGEGGMGQVYEAFDMDLRVRIALKVIRPGIAAQESMTKRFRHEVRLARSITHTNVCRTFDLERASIGPALSQVEELVFLTMEYLDGETLAARLARSSPLPLREALSIAVQMAAGIDAAHQHGVVHRDLKPQNVLLTTVAEHAVPDHSSGPLRVVITDFGLAGIDPTRVVATDQSASAQHLEVAGSFAYMAPEQIAGGPAVAATDIYSFGLILFEMVTGQQAFPPATFLQDLSRRFGPHAPSPQAVNPSVPDVWNRAIARCLAQRPELRFQSARYVTALLCEEATDAAPVQPTPAAIPLKPFASSPALPRAALAALFLSVVLVSSLLILSRYKGADRTDTSVPPGALVYMPAITNQTRNERFDQVTEMMRTALAQSPRITLLDRAQEADMLQRMNRPVNTVVSDSTAREVAMRAGARRVILTRLTDEGSLLRLTVSVQQPESSTPGRARNHTDRSWTCCSASITATGEIPADLLHIIRDASDWVRKTAGEANEDIASLNAPVEDLTTMDWGALTEYAKAERLQRVGRSSDAIIALSNAVHLDPEFALAYARLGDILFSVERSAEGLQAYRKALEAGNQRRLTRRERDRLRGQYAIDTWDFQTAESIFRDATVYYDHDYLSWFYRGSVLIHLDRLPEAADTLRQAAALRPSATSALLTLGTALLVAQDQQGASLIARNLHDTGHEAEALWLKAEGQSLENQWEFADATLQQISLLGPSNLSSFAYGERARLAADHDRPDTAIRILAEGMEQDRKSGSASLLAEKQMDIAYLKCAAADYASCFADLQTALAAKHDPKSYRAASEVLSRAARQHPPLPVMKQIRGLFERAIHDSPGELYGVSGEIVRQQLRADRLLSRGKVPQAVQSFRKIHVLDPPAEADFRLGRSLGRAAEIEDNPVRREALLAESAKAYGSIVNMRPYLWYTCTFFPPSVYAEAQLHLKLAGQASHTSEQILQAHPANQRAMDRVRTTTGTYNPSARGHRSDR